MTTDPLRVKIEDLLMTFANNLRDVRMDPLGRTKVLHETSEAVANLIRDDNPPEYLDQSTRDKHMAGLKDAWLKQGGTEDGWPSIEQEIGWVVSSSYQRGFKLGKRQAMRKLDV